MKGLIHNRFIRRIFSALFSGAKNQVLWNLITPILKFVKMKSGDCIFCGIVEGKIASKKVYEDDEVLAFHDINPQAPVHILVIPKKHISTLRDISEDDKDLIFKLLSVCNKISDDQGIGERGYRIVINTNPHGGQTVYHLHLHVIGGRQMRWPPG